MKYITNMTCRVCGEELNTGWCRFKIIRWFKRIKLKRNHLKKHSDEEVITYKLKKIKELMEGDIEYESYI